MTLFKRIEIDLVKERARINKCGYNKRQKETLLKLVSLFELGEFQKCLDLVNDKTAFPYNEKGEYPEAEHIGIEIGDLLHSMAYHNYYTRDELLEQAKNLLTRPEKTAIL